MTKVPEKILLLDQKFETELGEIVIHVFADELMGDISRYQDMLRTARGIPFDLSTVSSADPLALLASQNMDWATPEEIVEATRQHYEKLVNDARNHAILLALTKKTPKYTFVPEPWVEEPIGEDWEFSLPTPVLNLNNPLERRLRQITMMMDSSVEVRLELAKAMNVMFVEAERRSRELDDDGFRTGGIARSVPSQIVPASGKPKRRSAASVGTVLEGDGHTLHESSGSDATG